MPEMIIKSIAPWFGGKRTMAPVIVDQLGKHTQYFEPFCGSYAVLFNKPKSQKEMVCDLHGDATNLARVVQTESMAVKLYDRAARTPMAEGILSDAREFLEAGFDFETRDPELMIDRAYWFFLASWMGRNGCAGTRRIDYQIAVRFTKGGGSPTVRWQHAYESIPAWCQRLQGVVILNRDSFTIVNNFEDCAETVIYADPPYYKPTRSGFSHGGGVYLHEFNHGLGHPFTPSDQPDACKLCGLPEADHQCHHAKLAEALQQYQRARIVVSYYDHPYIRELYQGWTVLEKPMVKRVASMAKGKPAESEAPEILLINGPAYLQPRELF